VATAAGYASAGTVEMLLTDAGEFFFLEMNTRLQVEHPVTEEVTGRDLVEDQLRIAGGATLAELGLTEPPAIRGHAIEARVYAEDPEAGFLPATGPVCLVSWPQGVRIDSGVREEDEVTDRYDPMLAKVIAHGATRGEALGRLRAALAGTTILGVRTNVRFLRWLLEQPAMRDGEVRTDTIAGMTLPDPPRVEEPHWQAAALIVGPTGVPPWSGGWRLNAAPTLRMRHADEDRVVALDVGDDGTDGWTWRGPMATDGGSAIFVDVDGQSLEFSLAPPPTVEEAVRHAAAAGGSGSSILTSPMPGRVIAVRVAEGATVRAHEPVVIIEAMKMEHAVVSPVDGTLARLLVSEGQQVQRGDVLGEVAQSDA
ncbi:MAG TPA: biotin/lipoyl-containing protein, partial [Candidatus Binatia bacterium]|nr:biotin/lipoyl-containing protein [Candidatus Binatia bacterium]